MRIGDGGGKPGSDMVRRQRAKPGQRQRREIAALCRRKAVNLVHDHGAELGEKPRRIRRGQHQHQAFRRGEEDVRRRLTLAGAFRGRGVSGAALDRDEQAHFLDWAHEVALDIVRERLQRRYVKRVNAVRLRLMAIDQARQEAGKGLAAACRRDQKCGPPFTVCAHHILLVGVRPPASRAEPNLYKTGEAQIQFSMGRIFAVVY